MKSAPFSPNRTIFFTILIVCCFCLFPLFAVQANAAGTTGRVCSVPTETALTPAADNATTVAQCVFTALFNAIGESQVCEQDPLCITSVVFSMVVDIIECTDESNEDLELASCIFESVLVMIRSISLCGESNPQCVFSSIYTMIIDILECNNEYNESDILIPQNVY